MPFVPKFESIFESLAPDNVLQILKDDLKLALDYFYPPVAAGSPLLDDSVSRPIGTAVLHMDGFTTKPGVGDEFTIAGDPQLYTVTGATNLVGTDSDVSFSPGLQVAIPAVDGNQVVTFGLPDLAQRTLGGFGSLLFPALAIEPFKNSGDGDDNDHFSERTAKIVMSLAVTDTDRINVTRRLVKYVRAVSSVLETASEARFIAGAPTNRILMNTRTLSWEYRDPGKRTNPSTLWMKPAELELTIKYNER